MRGWARVGGALAVLMLALSPVGGDIGAHGDEMPAVTVTPDTGIIDGQPVTVNIKTSPELPVYEARVALCRAGVTYEGSNQSFPNQDFQEDGPNCPGQSHPVSTSSDSMIINSNTFDNAPRPEGESFQFRVGSGVTTWNDTTQPSPTEVSLTCDQTHPCAVVVEARYGPSGVAPSWKPYVFPMAYGNPDPIAGCGGPAEAVLDTAASDALSDAWINWTIGACGLPGAKGAPTRASFVGEGSAVTQFSRGAVDLAYTSAGYDDRAGLIDGSAPRRAAVAVPVALSAAVIAAGGGVLESGHKVPFKDIALTPSEAAAMIGGGGRGLEQETPASTPDAPRTYAEDISARNAELAKTGLTTETSQFIFGAFAEGESATWYATRLFDGAGSDGWHVPNVSVFGEDAGKDRGVTSALALAQPGFNGAVDLLSGRPALKKGLTGINPRAQGPVWVLADLSTARAVGMTPARIESHGDFVAPTPSTMAAALAGMKANDQGILVGDPNAAPAGAYPLTFVEYALVPAEPLHEDDCSLRTGSQTLLDTWLKHITGAGQADLPAGLVALPADLKTQAAAAIAKVGKSPLTGACAKTESTGGGSGETLGGSEVAAPAGFGPDASGSVALPLSSLALPTTMLGADNAVVPGAGAASAADGKDIVKTADIPPFLGRRAVSAFGTAFALTGIVCAIVLALYSSTRTQVAGMRGS